MSSRGTEKTVEVTVKENGQDKVVKIVVKKPNNATISSTKSTSQGLDRLC